MLAPGFSFGIDAELNGKSIVRFDSSLSLGPYGKLGLGFGGGSVGFNGVVDPAINFGLNRNLWQISKWLTVFVRPISSNTSRNKGVLHALVTCASRRFVDNLCARHPRECLRWLRIGSPRRRRSSFIFGFVSGVDYPVSPAVNLFAHLGLIVVPGFFGYIDFSADFAISRAIDACGKLPVGFSGTFGLGLGLRFGF